MKLSPLMCLVLFFSSSSTLAQDRPNYGLSQSLYNKLHKIENQLQTQQEENEDNIRFHLEHAALKAKGILENCQNCNPYEIASVHRYMAWLNFQTDRIDSTIKHYTAIVALSPDISVEFEQEALLALSKLYFQQEQYLPALQSVENLINLTQAVPADFYELKARILYMTNKIPAAIKNIELAINQIENDGGVPNESWYLFARSLYYNQESFSFCLAMQKKLVEHYSKDAHWRDLAVFYGLLGDEMNQIAAYNTLWNINRLSHETDLLNFANVLQTIDYPWKAAQVLEQAFNKGHIEKTAQNLESSARAWYLAKETDKALAYLEKASILANKASTYSFLSDLYMESEKYNMVLIATDNGLALTNEGSKINAKLLINKGVALFHLSHFDKAIKTFQLASTTGHQQSLVKNWIQHIEKQRLIHSELKILL